MASIKTYKHCRRRSQSASASSAGPFSAPETIWRSSVKRSRSLLTSNSPRVGVSGRHSKRRRRDSSPLCNIEFYSGRSTGALHNSSNPPSPSFPMTPADFHLFPTSSPSRRRSGLSFTPSQMELPVPPEVDDTALSRLRSNAFWELHQSIAENGECLVQRMRDYELSGSRSDVHAKTKEMYTDSDDDEIMIYMGERTSLSDNAHELTDDPLVKACRTSQAKLSCITSLSGLGVGEASPSVHAKTSWAFHSPSFASTSIPSSDCPDVMMESLTISPSSHSPHPDDSPQMHSQASSYGSEKAVAALSLAIANGAGGLNDYHALLAMQARNSLEDCEVGEMWH